MKTYTIEELKNKATKCRINGKSVDEILNKFLESLEVPATERISSFEDACDETGKDDDLPFDPNTKDPIERSANGFYKLCVIAKALNEEWEIDITNKKQEVWWNWVDLRGLFSGGSTADGAYSGFGYSLVYAPSVAYARLGSRLCLRSKAIAEHFRLKFIPIWCEYLIPEFEQ